MCKVLRVERSDDAVIAAVLVPKFDDLTTARFREELREATAGDGELPFLLDLSRVTFMPSVTLGPLVELSNELKRRCRRCVLVGVQPEVAKILALTMLDTILDLQPTVDDALRSG